MRVLELTEEDWVYLEIQLVARKIAGVFDISWEELGIANINEARSENCDGSGVPWGTTDVDLVPPTR